MMAATSLVKGRILSVGVCSLGDGMNTLSVWRRAAQRLDATADPPEDLRHRTNMSAPPAIVATGSVQDRLAIN